MTTYRCIILGAAGRDFHDFRRFFLERPELRVCCFTAQQIPFIEQRSYPKELAGPSYDEDIPIFDEDGLPELIERYAADFVFLSYSDLAHVDVMHKASIVQAAGASFALLGPRQTQLASSLPVVAVTGVRTGVGKSPLSQTIAAYLAGQGRRVAVLRHPMPYGDLRQQAVQQLATMEDLDRAECTIEEREEYEPYIERGLVVFAGVDYEKILRSAEVDHDAVLWDGGNNDTPFVRPDLTIVVADALRAGHELAYYPGETNFRAADVVVINKVDAAQPDAVALVRRHAAEVNARAAVIEAELRVTVQQPEAIAGRRVLVVEDGPTLTHGGMSTGAGVVAARRHGAEELVDPRPFAVGTIAEAYREYPHVGPVLPALGYSEPQRKELSETIRAAAPDVVIDASPASLERFVKVDIPVVRVSYAFEQRDGAPILEIVDRALNVKPT